MRIVGGRWRGRKLADPGAGDPAAHLRPTTDRVRETLFNLLTNGRLGDVVRGARVLDLFAGTGALGLEALSRGAAHATLLDTGRAAQRLLRANIATLGAAAEVTLRQADATAPGPAPGAPHDLVFLDPPYGHGLGEAALSAVLASGWLSEDATVVWEEEAPVAIPPGFTLRDQRNYGRTTLSILSRD